MSKDNVTQLPTQPNQTELTIDQVMKDFDNWRNSKASPSDKIPEHLWDKVFQLLENRRIDTNVIRSLLGITQSQLKYQLEKREAAKEVKIKPDSTQKKSTASINFKEVRQHDKDNYKPEKYHNEYIPATNTLIAEFYREDGKCLKIHATTATIRELLLGFYGHDDGLK